MLIYYVYTLLIFVLNKNEGFKSIQVKYYFTYTLYLFLNINYYATHKKIYYANILIKDCIIINI